MKIKTKKERRETDLLMELQRDHGFMIMRAGRGVGRGVDRYVHTFKFSDPKNTSETKYVVLMAVPIDSSLARAMIEADRVHDKAKTKTKTKTRRK